MSDLTRSTTIVSIFKSVPIIRKIAYAGSIMLAVLYGAALHKLIDNPDWLLALMVAGASIAWPVNLFIWRNVLRADSRLRANMTDEECALYDKVCNTDTTEGYGLIHRLVVDVEQRSRQS